MDRRRLRPPALVRALVVTIVVVLVGCGGDDADGEAGDITSADAVVEDGAAAFAASCASCHGSDLRGTDRGPSLLSEVYEPGHHPDDAFRAAIARGSRAHHWDFGDMPPVPGLEPDEIDAVIAFVRDRQETHGLEPYPPR
jgi:mono/diheme cytochrome c family protein